MLNQLLGGRYRLVRQLGEGGMGEVWEARDETLDRRVAVKLISLLAGGGSRGDEARARFLREARITARLQHPHIVTIHDLGETETDGDKVPFLVMELVQGEGLDAKLRQGVVTSTDAARWGAQICDALTEAHGRGIMHRDIKPSNILITPSGAVKVLDFGVARAADPYATADRLTQTGFIVGTPPYMAPEQARGHPEPRSDLYALGCVLFELITGRLPFQAPDTVGYLSAHLTQEPPAPSSVSTEIPTSWDALVLRLLHKDPAERYQTAADVAHALLQLDQVLEPASSTVPVRWSATTPDRTAVLPSQSPAARPSATAPEPLSGHSNTGRTRKAAAAGAFWLLLTLVTGIWLNSDAYEEPSSVWDTATGTSVIGLAAAGLVGCCVLAMRADRPRSQPNRVLAVLERFALPPVLFFLYAVNTYFDATNYFIYEGRNYSTPLGAEEAVGAGLPTLPLASALVLTMVLTSRSGALTRRVGYTAATLFLLVTVGDVTFYVADGTSIPVAAMTFALFCSREIKTRRVQSGQELQTT